MTENEMTNVSSGELETDDDRMEFTQGVRKRLITEMTQAGLPSDKGDRMVLLAALGDMDRTALANKKIGSQEKQGAGDRQAAILIARLAAHQFNTPSGNPFERPVIEGEASRITPELDETDLPPLQLAPGETSIGLSTMTYDQFMQKMEHGESADEGEE